MIDEHLKVSGRYWCTLAKQWRNIGFASTEDAEEWESDSGIKLENLHTRQGAQ